MEALSFGPEDAETLDHILEVVQYRVSTTGDDAAEETVRRLEQLRDTCRTESLVLTLAEKADEGRA